MKTVFKITAITLLFVSSVIISFFAYKIYENAKFFLKGIWTFFPSYFFSFFRAGHVLTLWHPATNNKHSRQLHTTKIFTIGVNQKVNLTKFWNDCVIVNDLTNRTTVGNILHFS